MINIKKFNDFIKENQDNKETKEKEEPLSKNKGKGLGGDTDLFNKPTSKQTINKGDLNPIDNLGIMGKPFKTEKIDGIVKNVSGELVYIEDFKSQKIITVPLTEFLKQHKKNESITFNQ